MIEFIEEKHLYLYNGVIIPSVSQILHEKIFPDKYKNIPERILKNKAIYGTQIHSAIEIYENMLKVVQKDEALYTATFMLSELQQESINDYLQLKEINKIEVIEQEQLICYKGIYAGRFDMIAKVDGEESLIDIKTTSQLDKEYLSWQLSLYELGYGKRFKRLYCLWLPKKGKAKLVEIKRKSKKEIEKVIY